MLLSVDNRIDLWHSFRKEKLQLKKLNTLYPYMINDQDETVFPQNLNSSIGVIYFFNALHTWGITKLVIRNDDDDWIYKQLSMCVAIMADFFIIIHIKCRRTCVLRVIIQLKCQLIVFVQPHLSKMLGLYYCIESNAVDKLYELNSSAHQLDNLLLSFYWSIRQFLSQ